MIGVGLLGAGFMARTHAAAWSTLGGRAQVRVVAARREEAALAVAEICGAEATADLAAVISRDDVEIVDICLPTPLHREWAEAAFAAGKHVLLEKPISLTADDAEAILAARDASGCMLLVGFVLRFWPEYEELLRVVQAGTIGTPQMVSTLRIASPPDWNDWMLDPSVSGGVAVDLLVHDFDQVASLVGTPTAVHATAITAGPFDAVQHVAVTLTCEHGRAVVEGGLLLPTSYPFTSGIRVLGTAGVLEYPFTATPNTDGGNIGGVDQTANVLTLYTTAGERSVVPVAAGDPWQRQAEYFARCVESNVAPQRATGEQALLALRIALAVNRSIVSGNVESV